MSGRLRYEIAERGNSRGGNCQGMEAGRFRVHRGQGEGEAGKRRQQEDKAGRAGWNKSLDRPGWSKKLEVYSVGKPGIRTIRYG